MASSIPITVHLITRHNPKEPLHEAFANMGVYPEDIAAFTKRWGPPAVRPGLNGDELDWRKALMFRGRLRRAWRGETDLEDGSRLLSTISAPLRVTAERIEVDPGQLWQTAFLLFMRDRQRGRIAVCANPDCETPYMLRDRKTRKVCGDPKCVAYLARPQKKRWWDANGNEWRLRRKKR